jgi:hypothetical protein
MHHYQEESLPNHISADGIVVRSEMIIGDWTVGGAGFQVSCLEICQGQKVHGYCDECPPDENWKVCIVGCIGSECVCILFAYENDVKCVEVSGRDHLLPDNISVANIYVLGKET